MKIYYGSLLNVALVAAASQLLAQVDVAYAKLSSSSMRRLLPDDSIADHILSESNTHFIIAAEIDEDGGAAHPDIRVRLSEDAVTEHTIISYDDGSSRRRGLSSRRVLVSTMAGTFSTISVHTKDGFARGIVQHPGEASKDIVQKQGQRTLISKSEELETPHWECSLDHDEHSDRHLSEEDEHDHHRHDHSRKDHNHDNHHHAFDFESTESAIDTIRHSLRGSNRHNRKLLFGDAYVYQADVYLDIDKDFVQKQGEGTEEGALDYVNSIWSAVNNIYEEEVGLHFNIKHIRITSEWETDASGNSYQSDWGSNQITDVENRMLMKHNTNATFWQEHDLYHAHLSRFQWGGHAKQVGALCNHATSASVTTDLRGNLGKLGYLSFDLYITSHELGHNAGSHHTHSTTQYQPAVDSCNDPNQCSKVDDNSGTIMSYCHLCQDTRKVYTTLGGTYSGTGDISRATNWDNNPNLQGGTSKNPKRVPLAMCSYLSALNDATSCLAILDDPVTTVPPVTSAVATTTVSQATSATEAPPTSTCNGDGICQPDDGENCRNCPDCAEVTNGNPKNRYCCGDGTGDTINCADPRCTNAAWQCEMNAVGELFEYCNI